MRTCLPSPNPDGPPGGGRSGRGNHKLLSHFEFPICQVPDHAYTRPRKNGPERESPHALRGSFDVDPKLHASHVRWRPLSRPAPKLDRILIWRSFWPFRISTSFFASSRRWPMKRRALLLFFAFALAFAAPA